MIFALLAEFMFGEMKGGGGWTVESFVDEFGDPTGGTYYLKRAEGTYTTDIMKSTGRGTVFCIVYSQKLFGIITTRDGSPITFFLSSYYQSIYACYKRYV